MREERRRLRLCSTPAQGRRHSITNVFGHVPLRALAPSHVRDATLPITAGRTSRRNSTSGRQESLAFNTQNFVLRPSTVYITLIRHTVDRIESLYFLRANGPKKVIGEPKTRTYL